jgi:hypothetical protein
VGFDLRLGRSVVENHPMNRFAGEEK